jgi:hypothetical protein
MPKTIGEKIPRTTLALPKPLVEEIDRIVGTFPQYAWNRQKFAEEAIREKIFALEHPPATEQKPREVTAPPEQLFCRYCGSKNAKDAIFCQKCGKPIK